MLIPLIALLSTEKLGWAGVPRDVQDITVSLRFQDLTRQHIERAIDPPQHIHRDSEPMRTLLQGISASDRGSRRTS